MEMNLEEICKDLPEEFLLIFTYLRTLNFKSEPNYYLI